MIGNFVGPGPLRAAELIGRGGAKASERDDSHQGIRTIHLTRLALKTARHHVEACTWNLPLRRNVRWERLQVQDRGPVEETSTFHTITAFPDNLTRVLELAISIGDLFEIHLLNKRD